HAGTCPATGRDAPLHLRGLGRHRGGQAGSAHRHHPPQAAAARAHPRPAQAPSAAALIETAAMLRTGPVPLFLHGLLEYAAGALLVIAPFLFGFDSGAAKATGIITGVLVIVVAAVTEAPTGISKSLPLAV